MCEPSSIYSVWLCVTIVCVYFGTKRKKKFENETIMRIYPFVGVCVCVRILCMRALELMWLIDISDIWKNIYHRPIEYVSRCIYVIRANIYPNFYHKNQMINKCQLSVVCVCVLATTPWLSDYVFLLFRFILFCFCSWEWSTKSFLFDAGFYAITSIDMYMLRGNREKRPPNNDL